MNQSGWVIAALVASLLLAAFLQLYVIDLWSLWGDEAGSVRVASAPDVAGVLVEHSKIERQPPGHYLFLHWTIGLLGRSELAVRLPSALLSIASVGLVAWIGWRIAGPRTAAIAAFLVAASPFFVLYGRMARYYALGTFLALLSTALLVEAVQQRPPRGRALLLWAGYALAAYLLLMTSYNSAGVVLAQALFVLFVTLGELVRAGRKDGWAPRALAAQPAVRQVLAPWIATQLLIAAGVGVWIWFSAARLNQIVTNPDPTQRQRLLTVILDFLYPLYAFGVGETLFPWHPAAIVGVIAVAIAGIAGLVWLRRFGPVGWLPVLTVAGSLVVTVLAFLTVARDQPFNAVASKSVWAAPFFLLIIAAGIASLRPAFRAALLVVLTGVAGFGLANLYTGQQYFNPSYAVPTREMLQLVLANSRPDDLIIAESPWLVEYYYRPQPGQPRLVASNQSAQVQAALAEGAHGRVWVVSLGGYGSFITSDNLRNWITERYQPAGWWGFARQDDTYLDLKARIQGEREPDYRASIELFTH